jgi:hypothetical protein
LQGSKHRAVAAYKEYEKQNGCRPDIAFGLEGGLEWITTSTTTLENTDTERPSLFCMAWIAAYGHPSNYTTAAVSNSLDDAADTRAIFSYARSASFAVPPSITKLIQDGMELGDADDHVFQRVDSKRGNGTVGILTNGIIDRAHYYEHAVVLALTPWIQPDVYPNESLDKE